MKRTLSSWNSTRVGWKAAALGNLIHTLGLFCTSPSQGSAVSGTASEVKLLPKTYGNPNLDNPKRMMSDANNSLTESASIKIRRGDKTQIEYQLKKERQWAQEKKSGNSVWRFSSVLLKRSDVGNIIDGKRTAWWNNNVKTKIKSKKVALKRYYRSQRMTWISKAKGLLLLSSCNTDWLRLSLTVSHCLLWPIPIRSHNTKLFGFCFTSDAILI